MSVAIQLSWVDWSIITLYFVFIIGIGFYLKRFTGTGEDYFLAGRKNSSWVAGLAFLSANLGALEILGWTGGTMKYGMFVSHFYWVGAIPAMLFLGLYMMPFYYSSKIHSVPGYLKLRFDERSRLLNAFSFAIMTLLMSGINLYLMALVLRTILGWDWHLSMWISALAVGCYIMLGGLMSAIFTANNPPKPIAPTSRVSQEQTTDATSRRYHQTSEATSRLSLLTPLSSPSLPLPYTHASSRSTRRSCSLASWTPCL
ncbi:MAG TPA: hypothetical protein PLG50_10430, partial [bacterium]|nr:hypothetical protein [bacterium]